MPQRVTPKRDRARQYRQQRVEELADELADLERIQHPTEADLWEMLAVREEMDRCEELGLDGYDLVDW